MPRKEPRDYQKEYADFHGKPKRVKERSLKNQGRKKYEKANGDLPREMEVDHIKPVSKGGKNNMSNLRAVKRTVNRKKGTR
jgi:5-methylcytosine-specific restriction endonuclease McrA